MPTQDSAGVPLPLSGMNQPLMGPRSESSRSASSLPPLEMTDMNDRRLSYETLSGERTCFICLDGTDSDDDPLVPCCTRCFTVCHGRCWTDWRTSQANHARRVRLAGNRVSADPFLCSICKTGSARVGGERVTVRWLESFANFARSTSSHPVRFASGLFSALSGARDERRTRGSPIAPNDDPNTSDEDDFFEFMDSEIDRGNSGRLFGENTKKFFLINFLGLGSGFVICAALSELGIGDGLTIFMAAWVTLYVYLVLVVGYVIWRFQQLMTDRYLGEEV